MSLQQDPYEELLASFSHHHRAVELLRNYRPYFERIPSIRRSSESVITIPLPVIKVRQRGLNSINSGHETPYELIAIPCDLALLMCDPEWQIKTEVEFFVFIHRPGEELSDLLRRWRETQVLLSRGYSWEMPLRYQHIFSEGADRPLPLFVLTNGTSERIRRGLAGAGLPAVMIPIENASVLQKEVSKKEMPRAEVEARTEHLNWEMETDSGFDSSESVS